MPEDLYEDYKMRRKKSVRSIFEKQNKKLRSLCTQKQHMEKQQEELFVKYWSQLSEMGDTQMKWYRDKEQMIQDTINEL